MNLKKSLKPIKQRLVTKHQAYTTIRQVYTHLAKMSNEEILDYYQVKDVDALEKHIEHIKTVLKNRTIDYKEALEPIDRCFCIDTEGNLKFLYPTEKEAQKQKEQTQKTKAIKLKIYLCPYHCGWHLSKVNLI
jgi:hypothetical protein